MKAGTLVEIEWRDSERVTLGWATRKKYQTAASDEATYRTAGYVVSDDAKQITVSHSRSERGTYCDAMIIPRGAVIRVKRL